jgi:hypothetical protein
LLIVVGLFVVARLQRRQVRHGSAV